MAELPVHPTRPVGNPLGAVDAAALTAAGVPHTFHRYDSAGHAFQMFNNPERYRKEASEDAWHKVLAFMGEALN